MTDQFPPSQTTLPLEADPQASAQRASSQLSNDWVPSPGERMAQAARNMADLLKPSMPAPAKTMAALESEPARLQHLGPPSIRLTKGLMAGVTTGLFLVGACLFTAGTFLGLSLGQAHVEAPERKAWREAMEEQRFVNQPEKTKAPMAERPVSLLPSASAAPAPTPAPVPVPAPGPVTAPPAPVGAGQVRNLAPEIEAPRTEEITQLPPSLGLEDVIQAEDEVPVKAPKRQLEPTAVRTVSTVASRPVPSKPTPPKAGSIALQVGAFSSSANAARLAEALHTKGHQVAQVRTEGANGKRLHGVRLTGFKSRSEAEAAAALLFQTEKLKAFVVEPE
ncbi:MAG: SPOR domain-containing protein [Magnetovibrionaceae bacterium]